MKDSHLFIVSKPCDQWLNIFLRILGCCLFFLYWYGSADYLLYCCGTGALMVGMENQTMNFPFFAEFLFVIIKWVNYIFCESFLHGTAGWTNVFAEIWKAINLLLYLIDNFDQLGLIDLLNLIKTIVYSKTTSVVLKYTVWSEWSDNNMVLQSVCKLRCQMLNGVTINFI